MVLLEVLTLGFFLGVRHATDPDHVVAISAVVSRERSLRAAAPIGMFWGLGHTATILLVGGAIILFGIVIPPRLGLGMEFSVGLMLLLLGGITIRGVLRDASIQGHRKEHAHELQEASQASEERSAMQPSEGGRPGLMSYAPRLLRPFLVGLVHGMAGSAAIALLILGTIHDPIMGILYLMIFGAGTIVGMMLITTMLAISVNALRRFDWVHRALGLVTGTASIALGVLLTFDLGFSHGLFSMHPHWTPQ